MAEIITTAEIKNFLASIQGREVTLADIRKEFNILPGSKSFDAVRIIMFQLAEQKIVKPTGRKNGSYKVISQVQPVQIFGVQRERRLPFPLKFPRDFDRDMEMDFAEQVIIREGDLVCISGLSNYGKTTLAMQFCAENLDLRPVLMGNEYTTPDGEPSQRFLNRLDSMAEWVQWMDSDGQDRFTLLPVRDDYAEHIVKDRINIIDWINIETGEHYLINTIMGDIKRAVGRGVAIIAIQKAEGAVAGRGGQFTKDFTDCELLIDKFGETEVLLTIGKVKEAKRNLAGMAYAYGIQKGVKIINFREVKKCGHCFGKGFTTRGQCDVCNGKKFVDA